MTQPVRKDSDVALYLVCRPEMLAEPFCECHPDRVFGAVRPSMLTIAWAKRLGSGSDRRI